MLIWFGSTTQQPQGLKNWSGQKQLLLRPLEADSKSVSFPVDIHANEPRFTAEINMF